MGDIITLVTSIISGGVSGIAVNILTERYKEKKKNQIYEELFIEKVQKFIKLTNKFIDVKLANTDQPELDLLVGIRNLKRAYQNESTYQGVLNQILEFDSASCVKLQRKNIIEIQDKVINIKIRIFQIDVDAEYSKGLEEHYKICHKEIVTYLSEIKSLI